MALKRLLVKALLPLLSILLSQALYSQTKQITGQIKDSKGAGVIGASVVVKGSKTGTSTNAEGVFRIAVPESAKTLIITAVGFTAQEADISTGTAVSVILVESSSNLNEIVVVGYGTARRRDLTGAVASVQAKD